MCVSNYTGLAKKFIQVFPLHLMEKPKRTYWPTQYDDRDSTSFGDSLQNLGPAFWEPGELERKLRLLLLNYREPEMWAG